MIGDDERGGRFQVTTKAPENLFGARNRACELAKGNLDKCPIANRECPIAK